MYRKLRKTSPDSDDFQTRTTNLKTANTILKRSIHTAKKQYYNSCFDKYKNNIKQTWSTINNILNKNNKKHKLPDLFNINGTLTNNKKDIVNSFNRYFCNIGPKLESAIIIDSNKSYNHYLKNPTTATFHFEPTNSTTVTKIINELKPRHSTGPDGLSTKLLQHIKEPLIEAITITLNQSLNTGIFPEKLKIAKVIPIHKKSIAFRKLPTDFNLTIYL